MTSLHLFDSTGDARRADEHDLLHGDVGEIRVHRGEEDGLLYGTMFGERRPRPTDPAALALWKRRYQANWKAERRRRLAATGTGKPIGAGAPVGEAADLAEGVATPGEIARHDAKMRLKYERLAFTYLSHRRWCEEHGSDDW
jgi:hypothetical protein